MWGVLCPSTKAPSAVSRASWCKAPITLSPWLIVGGELHLFFGVGLLVFQGRITWGWRDLVHDDPRRVSVYLTAARDLKSISCESPHGIRERAPCTMAAIRLN